MRFRPFKYVPLPRLPLKYLAPNLVTAANMMLGLAAAWHALRGRVDFAAWLVIWAAFLDGTDGLIARLFDARSHFGIELASLADLTRFGLAPAAVMASYADDLGVGVWDGSQSGWLVLAPVTFYVVMAAVRLARFNVQTIELGDLLFRGLPTTLCAGIISTGILTLIKMGDPVSSKDGVILLVGGAAVIAGFLMISNRPLPKFRKRGRKIYSVGQYVLAGLLLVLGFMRRMPEVLLAAGTIYILGGIVMGKRFERAYRREQDRRKLLAREAGRALERLSDVDEEPDPEENGGAQQSPEESPAKLR